MRGWSRATAARAGRGILLLTFVALAACDAGNHVAPDAGVCVSPAPIRNVRDPQAPAIFVTLKTGVDGSATIARLEGQLDFTVIWEPTGQGGFLANLTDRQISLVQCDTAVAFLEWGVVVSVGSRAPGMEGQPY